MSPRPLVRSTAGWLFGFAVTILLISMWGRAVVVDTDTLEDSISPMARSAMVVDLFTDWLGEELTDAGVEPVVVDSAVEQVLETPAVDNALDRFVGEVVEAAAVPGTVGSSVEMSRVVAPAVPEIVSTLNGVGVDISEAQVDELVADLDPFVIRREGTSPYVGPSAPVAVRLGTASALALVVILLAGGVAVVTSSDRLSEVRSLLTRMALGAFSFALLLRLGSWVLDPGGGRAPIEETVWGLARSKWMVPLTLAAVSGGLALSIWMMRGVRRQATSRRQDEGPTPRQERRLTRTG